MHSHHHNHHRESVFELLHEEHHHGCCDHHDHPVCGHVHKIAGTNIPFKVGDFIYWNSTTEAYALAIENHCDLMVTKVNQSKTWFEAANLGDFELKNYTLKGELFINAAGELTNTKTNTKVGFIDNGHLYLLISAPNMPIATSDSNRIALIGYDNVGALKVWYYDIATSAIITD